MGGGEVNPAQLMQARPLASAFGLLLAGLFNLVFGLASTSPIKIGGPMNIHLFGSLLVSLMVGIPLFLATVVLTWWAAPYRRWVKGVLLVSGVAVLGFTALNFFELPLSAYDLGEERFDPIDDGQGYAPANGGTFVVSILFGLGLLAVFFAGPKATPIPPATH